MAGIDDCSLYRVLRYRGLAHCRAGQCQHWLQERLFSFANSSAILWGCPTGRGILLLATFFPTSEVAHLFMQVPIVPLAFRAAIPYHLTWAVFAFNVLAALCTVRQRH